MEQGLDDIIARFWVDLYNYREDFQRICFILIEKPYWIYKDNWVKERNAASLEEDQFCMNLMQRCEFLQPLLKNFTNRFQEFQRQRGMVPKYGAILLNKAMDKVVLVSSHIHHNQGFPKGKINQGETEALCASREISEETGLDIAEMINEKEYIFMERVAGVKYLKLFVVTGLDETVEMKPTVKYEIEEVKFWPVSDLDRYTGKKHKQVQPFVGAIKKWLRKKAKNRISPVRTY